MNTPYKHDFINLASRVEEFTLRLLDAFIFDVHIRAKYFGCREVEVLVETAINLEQKKVHCKDQCNINGCNIVGQQLPTLVDITYCVRLHTLLHTVAQSLKPMKRFCKHLPRSATMLDPFAQLLQRTDVLYIYLQ